MEISSAQHQAMAAHQLMEGIILTGGCHKTTTDHQQQQERKVRPQPEQALKCPRCESTNTKFCYYNNYSLSQPRYFCKGCRRYWTQGGSLRNVPVGGSCRKNKRSSSSNSSKKPQDHQAQITTNSNPILLTNYNLPPLLGNPNPNPKISGTGFLDIMRSGFLDSSNPAGLSNLCYGFEGVGGATTAAPAAVDIEGENKVVMGHHWQFVGDGNSNSMAVDPAKDYWNGVGSYWHGLINSSMM